MIRPLIGLLALGLLACGGLRQEVVLPDLATSPSKLVMACFISPQDTVLTAIVSRSRPLLDSNATDNVLIFNALVTLSDGQQRVELPFVPALGYHRLPATALPIQAGQSYTLTAETPDGRQVTATATVPLPVPLTALQLDSSAGDGPLAVRAVWTNPPGKTTYYQVRGLLRIGFDSAPVVRQVAFADNGLITNEQGALFQLLVGYVSALQPAASNRQLSSVAVQIDLLHTDEPYYRYHRALSQQEQTEGNPFAEPVPIPTNIAGGLGCFAAYNRTTLQAQVR